MKKTLHKFLVPLFVMSLMLLALLGFAACDETNNAARYNFSEIKAESSDGMSSEMLNLMVPSLSAIYKDSYLSVSDTKIVWTMKEQSGEMTYSKDGDKYVLAGDFAKTFSDSLKGALGSIGGNVNASFEMYGIETETGFEIVTRQVVNTISIAFKYVFVKA